MKRVLVAGVLGGLLLLGTPTLASSAEKDERRSERSDKGDRHDRGDRRDHDGKDRDHRGDRDRHRYGHHRGGYYGGYYGYPGYGGYYGDPYWDGYSGGPRHGQVVVGGMAYNPPEVHSRAGDPVLWLFQDGGIPHTVTADNGSFDSGQKINDEYQLRFHHPGSYSYHCAIHPEMRGRVIIHG
jgi:hypothetical protein